MDERTDFTQEEALNYAAANEAIRNGQPRELARLLTAHPELASIRVIRARTLFNQLADWPGRWPRRLESAALLINAGADINARTGPGDFEETTLQEAVSCYDAALTDLIIEAGASPDGLNDDRRPLAEALFYEAGDAASVLVKHGAKIDLEFAAGLGRMDLLPAFFAADGSLLPAAGTHHPPVNKPEAPEKDAGSELPEQALAYACMNGQTEAAAYLIGHGANIHARPSGFTYRLPMVKWGDHHPEIVELLVQCGAAPPEPDPHEQDERDEQDEPAKKV